MSTSKQHSLYIIALVTIIFAPISHAVDYQESPLGLYLPWQKGQYTLAQADPDLLDQEWERLNETNATFLTSAVLDPSEHVSAYDQGLLTLRCDLESYSVTGVDPFLHVDWPGTIPDQIDHVRYSDLSNILGLQIDLPGDPDTIPPPDETMMSLNHIIKYYADMIESYPAQETDYLADATYLMQLVIDSNLDDNPYSNGKAFWKLLDEGWGRAAASDDWNNAVKMLWAAAADYIKSRDNIRPLVTIQSYRQVMDPPATDNSRLLTSDIMNGSAFPGLDIWIDDYYPFTPSVLEDNLTDVRYNRYDGEHYYRVLWYSRGIRWWRELSQKVYDNPEGPSEWWHCMQIQREITKLSNPVKYTFNYRRPTKFEFETQIYATLACGAKGIESFMYLSGYYPPPEDIAIPYAASPYNPSPAGDSPPAIIPPGFPVDTYNDVTLTNRNPVNYYHGMIGTACVSLVDDYDNDELFREPLDEGAESRDRRFVRMNVSGLNDLWEDEHDVDEQYEDPYPRESLKFAYENAAELLEYLRPLRWWWADTGAPEHEVNGYSYDEHISTVLADGSNYMMYGTYICNQFKLESISVNPESIYQGLAGDPLGTVYSSNLMIGLFDSPDSDPRSEYILVVNLRANEGGDTPASVVTDAVMPGGVNDYANKDEIKLYFDGSANYTTEVVWNSKNEIPTINKYGDLSSMSTEGNQKVLVVDIAAGDARLIRVSTHGEGEGGPTTTEYRPGDHGNNNNVFTISGDKGYYATEGTPALRILDGAQIKLDGDFMFSGDVEVYGYGGWGAQGDLDPAYSRLILAEGTTLSFAEGAKLIFHDPDGIDPDHGILEVEGTEANQNILHHGYPDEPSDAIWGGLAFGTPADPYEHDITLHNILISNAATGINTTGDGVCDLENVKVMGSTFGIVSSSDQFYIEKSVVNTCDTGIKLAVSAVTFIDDSHIYDCINAVDAYTGTQAPSTTYYIRDTMIEDIDEIGFQVQDAASVSIWRSTFQNIGRQAVGAVSVASLDIGDITTPPTDNIFRACGLAGQQESTAYSAIEIYSATDLWLSDTQIYENLGPAISVKGGSACRGGSGIMLANNSLGARGSDSGSQMLYAFNTEILFQNQGYLLWDNASSDFIDTWNGGGPANFPNYDEYHNFVSYLGSTLQPIHLDNTFLGWGEPNTSLTPYLVAADLVAERLYDGPYGGSLWIDPSTPFASSPYSNGNGYWAHVSSGEDTSSDLLNVAQALFDSTEYTAAKSLFMQLASSGFDPAIPGLIASDRCLGMTATEIVAELNSIQYDDSTGYYQFKQELGIANLYRSLGNYDESRDMFSQLADQSSCYVDSLTMLIDYEYTNVLELKRLGLVSPNDSTEIAMVRDADREITEAYGRIDALERMIREQSDRVFTAEEIPQDFELSDAYPNPFNPSVTIPFTLPVHADVRIGIYNILGQRVAVVLDRPLLAGKHAIHWNGRDMRGAQVASGVYFVQMKSAGFSQTKKIVMMK